MRDTGIVETGTVDTPEEVGVDAGVVIADVRGGVVGVLGPV